MLSTLDLETMQALALALAVLLASARLVGHLARRSGLPSVVGELTAGVLLGPTVLGLVAPDAAAAIVPDSGTVRIALDAFALLGVILLVASTGAALDLGRAARRLRPSLWLPVLSLVVPVAVGASVGWALPESFLGTASRPVAAAFVGVILGISALPTIARMLGDLDLLHREVGQLTLASAAVDDFAGWFLLAILTARFGGGASDLTVSVITAGGFLLVAWLLGRRLVDLVLRISLRMTETVAGPLTTVVVVVLTTVWIGMRVGLDPVVGALVAGVLLGQSPALRPSVQVSLDALTTAVLGPLFFVLAGAALDLRALTQPRDLLWTIVLLIAAVGSKVLGARLGAAMSGLPGRVGTAVGVGLSAHGGMGIVVAAVAVGAGVLSSTGYAAAVVVAVATSLAAPLVLHRLMQRMPADLEEREEAARRAALDASQILGARRVLLLTRGGAHSRVAARVLDLTLDPLATVTVLVVQGRPETDALGDPAAVGQAVADLMGHRRAQVRVATADDVAAAVRDEVRRGYDLLVLGASGEVQAPVQFGSVLNAIILDCPVPVMLVRSRLEAEGLSFQRLLAGASGTSTGQEAQDVAFALARHGGAELDVVHVIARSDRILQASWFQDAERQPAPHHLLAQATTRAALFGVHVATHTRVGSAAAEELLLAGEETLADTLVLATTTRALGDRPFLGHGVEYLLEHAPQNLVVLAFPTATSPPA